MRNTAVPKMAWWKSTRKAKPPGATQLRAIEGAMQMTRTLIGFTALLMLAGCGAEPAADGEQEAPAQVDEASLAADGGPSAGRYRATDEAGAILIEELRPDGTYAFSTEDGEIIEEGTYEQKSQDELCFTASAPGAPEMCYAETLGEDGIWRSVEPETDAVFVIERLED